MTVVSDYTSILTGSTWMGPGKTDAPVILSYSFEDVPQTYLAASGFSAAAIASFVSFDAGERAAARAALAAWADVSGLTFVEGPAGTGDIRFAKLDFALVPGKQGAAGFAYYPSRDAVAGAGLGSYDYDFAIGGDVFVHTAYTASPYVLAHEIGHALGFKHPFDGDPTLDPALDTRATTIMSYTGFSDGTLAPFDVQAVQRVYGGPARDAATLSAWSWNAVTAELTETGKAGADRIFGTGQRDIVSGLGGDDVLAGFSGNDLLLGDDGNDRVDGGLGNDSLQGGSGIDRLTGGAGNDTLWGGEGRDTLYGDDGVDQLNGEAGNDGLDGGLGNDTLWGADGDDRLNGRDGDDFLSGGSGANELLGGRGNDTLSDAGVGSTLDGGAGSDSLDLDRLAATQAFTVDLVAMRSATGIVLADGTRLAGLERINALRLGAGNDKVLSDGKGWSWLYGGGGVDGLSVDYGWSSAAAWASVTAASQSLAAWQADGSQVTAQSGFETVRLAGGGAGDGLSLTGWAGSATLLGNGGDDALTGGAGNDRLEGGLGNDTLRGGSGRDALLGGAGRDRFVFDAPLARTANRDTIADFDPVQDSIVLENAVFTALTTVGALAAGAFVRGAGARDADDRVIYNPATGILYYDANGTLSGGRTQVAELAPNLAVGAGNIWVT